VLTPSVSAAKPTTETVQGVVKMHPAAVAAPSKPAYKALNRTYKPLSPTYWSQPTWTINKSLYGSLFSIAKSILKTGASQLNQSGDELDGNHQARNAQRQWLSSSHSGHGL
jgi:hypothetical protein